MNADRSLALAAASQAAEATAELLAFAREGALVAHGNFEGEPVEKLADALKMTLEIELRTGSFDGERNALYCELVKYLEGWVG